MEMVKMKQEKINKKESEITKSITKLTKLIANQNVKNTKLYVEQIIKIRLSDLVVLIQKSTELQIKEKVFE